MSEPWKYQRGIPWGRRRAVAEAQDRTGCPGKPWSCMKVYSSSLQSRIARSSENEPVYLFTYFEYQAKIHGHKPDTRPLHHLYFSPESKKSHTLAQKYPCVDYGMLSQAPLRKLHHGACTVETCWYLSKISQILNSRAYLDARILTKRFRDYIYFLKTAS